MRRELQRGLCRLGLELGHRFGWHWEWEDVTRGGGIGDREACQERLGSGL